MLALTCATTVDDVVSADGSAGCLIASHAVYTDEALAAEYGVILPPEETAEWVCQSAVAEAGRTYTGARLRAIQKCRNDLLAGKALFLDRAHTREITDVAVCPSEYTTNAKISRAGRQVRRRIAAAREPACTDDVVGNIAACTATVDGLVTLNGDGGCLITSHAEVVAKLLTAEYGQ